MARYQERIATDSLEDKEYVRETIALRRRESKRLMKEREREIDAGLRHMTYAMERKHGRTDDGESSIVQHR